MTGKQELIAILTMSGVISSLLFVGIMAWGWPSWLMFAVPVFGFPVLHMLLIEPFRKDALERRRGERRARRRHQPAGTR